MIGDRLNAVCHTILKNKDEWKVINSDLIERLGQMALISFTMFDKAMKSIVDKDLKIASDAVDLYDAVQLEEEKLLDEFQKEKTNFMSRLNNIAWEFKIIAEHSSAIAEISIDNILRKKNNICWIMDESEKK